MRFASIRSDEPDPERALRIAESTCILKGLVGSSLHGLSNAGTDDRDEMGVCVEPPEYVIGLRRFEHCVARTQTDGVPSGPGDLDLTIYGLRKFLRLAANGSPTTLLLFFVSGDDLLVQTELGEELQRLAPSLISRRTGQAFLGYLTTQARSLRGERTTNREREISAEHGYDTKFAMHALRVGYQGIELLETGRISLPVPEPIRSYLRQVRQGSLPLSEVLQEIREVTARLEKTVEEANVPTEVERATLDAFLIDAYQRHWATRASCDASRAIGDG